MVLALSVLPTHCELRTLNESDDGENLLERRLLQQQSEQSWVASAVRSDPAAAALWADADQLRDHLLGDNQSLLVQHARGPNVGFT